MEELKLQGIFTPSKTWCCIILIVKRAYVDTPCHSDFKSCHALFGVRNDTTGATVNETIIPMVPDCGEGMPSM